MTANHADPMSEPRDNEINYVEFPAADPATLTATKAFYHEVFAVRSDLPPESLGASVRRIVRGIDPQQPIFRFNTLEGLMQGVLQTPRMSSRLLAIFAGSALLLAMVGIYAVMHTSVAQRTREIGVRMALGAQRGEVQAMMLRRGGRLIALGIAAGAALAWPFARLLESFLFETPTTDPLVYTGAIVVIAFAGLGAVWFPARRATRVDPIIALRAE